MELTEKQLTEIENNITKYRDHLIIIKNTIHLINSLKTAIESKKTNGGISVVLSSNNSVCFNWLDQRIGKEKSIKIHKATIKYLEYIKNIFDKDKQRFKELPKNIEVEYE